MVERAQRTDKIEVVLEIGAEKTFASAVDWPGWCRGAASEAAALGLLLDYAPRYQEAVRASGIDFPVPAAISQFIVIERLQGNATTDFGVPGLPSSRDERLLEEQQLARWLALLAACWQAFDSAAVAALGKELRKGPRGGGRELQAIRRHVLEAESSYLSSLGGKIRLDKEAGTEAGFEQLHQAVRRALVQSARGELPAYGQRGGKRWSPRYFVRRAAWHILDHTWEIEDRAMDSVDGAAPQRYDPFFE